MSEQLGYIPPQSIELESAVLGACMLSRDAVDVVLSVLPRELDTFYTDAHKTVYKAILSLYSESKPIDLLTVTNQIRSNNELEIAGGAYAITKLTTSVNSDANVEYHCRVVMEKYFARIIIKANQKSITELYKEADPFEILEREYSKLLYIQTFINKKAVKSLPVIVDENLEKTKSAMTLPDHIIGIPTGFKILNDITAGWQNSDLIILAARPSIGKTGLSLEMAKAAALEGYKAVFFSLEMSENQLVVRLQSAEAGISLENINNGRIQQQEFIQLEHQSQSIKKLPLTIIDRPALTVLEIKAECNRLRKENGLHIIFIDYIQLMSGEGQNREAVIGGISRGLKGMAKDLDVPVIALSQLSRAVETRGGTKRPQLSDLRDSGSIEQDADMVLFLYRAEYYGLLEDKEGNSLLGMAEIIIAKNRQGRLGSIALQFIAKYVKFLDPQSTFGETSDRNQQLQEQYKGKSPDKEDNWFDKD